MNREGPTSERSGHVQRLGDLLTPEALRKGITPEREALSRLDDAADRRAIAIEQVHAEERWLSEVNFQRLPFAAVWDKRTGTIEPIVVEKTFLQDGAIARRRWQVIPGSKLGIPGPSAYATFRALEKIVLERTLGRGRPLTNPQEFDFVQICRELGLSIDDENNRRIKEDLRRIRACDFVDDGFLREKSTAASPKTAKTRARERRTETRFSLLSGLVFVRDMLPDGASATANIVWFGDFYLASVNSGYVKRLDWDLWKSLERPVARRLYELLDLELFARPQAPLIEFDYDELAQLLPVSRQKYAALAAQKLRGPLECLKGKVISSFDWRQDGDLRYLRLAPLESYRKSLAARRRPELDIRALELAKELKDPGSSGFYQKVVQSVDRSYIDMALSETRLALHDGANGCKAALANPAAYFTRSLSKILIDRKLPVPFTIGGGR